MVHVGSIVYQSIGLEFFLHVYEEVRSHNSR